MTNAERRLVKGDLVQFRAATWNDILDAADARRKPEIAGPPGPDRSTYWRPRCVVEARRDEAEDATIADRAPVVLRFYDSGLVDFTDDPTAANRDPEPRGLMIVAVSPADATAGDTDHVRAAAVGIALATIAPGRTGPVAVGGIVLAWVDVTNEGHRFARLGEGNPDELVSAAAGPCRILYATGTGRQLCPVLLNVGGSGGGGSTVVGFPTVYPVAALGTDPEMYTVRTCHRAGGVLFDDGGPDLTAYESQDRAVRLDPVGEPSQELALGVDAMGVYWFGIDQYTDGAATPAPLPGLVSIDTQIIKGRKQFISDVDVFNTFTVGNTLADPGGMLTVDILSNAKGKLQFGAPIAPPFDFKAGATMGTGQYPSSFDGFVWCYDGVGFTSHPAPSDGAYGTIGLIPGASEWFYVTGTGAAGETAPRISAQMSMNYSGRADGVLVEPLVYTGDDAFGIPSLFIHTASAYAIGDGASPVLGGVGYYGTWFRSGRSWTSAGDGATHTAYVAGGIVFRWDKVIPGAGGGGGGGGTPVSPAVPAVPPGTVVTLPPPPAGVPVPPAGTIEPAPPVGGEA